MQETSQGSQQIIPASPTAVDQAEGLLRLAEAARPLVQDVLRAQQESSRESRDHEWRLAELDARSQDKLQQRLFPLVWGAGLFLVGLGSWAAYIGRWEIATHIVGLLVGFAGGYGLAHQRFRRLEPETSDE